MAVYLQSLMKVSQGCNTISKTSYWGMGYQHIYWSPISSTACLEEESWAKLMMICCGKENVLTPSLGLCLPPSTLPAMAQAFQGFSFLPMPVRGSATLQLAGTAPVQLLHSQSSPQQDSSGHALAEMALSYVGMNLVMFWPILDSGLQPA